jgi:hypothetical protein
MTVPAWVHYAEVPPEPDCEHPERAQAYLPMGDGRPMLRICQPFLGGCGGWWNEYRPVMEAKPGASGCYSWSLLFLLVLTPLIAVACGVAVAALLRWRNR